ncbi:MAG: GNAT family N-acetyltransferase [Acidimicrobiales bacterium]
MSPVADAPPPSPAFIRRCLDQLAARGYHDVITGALSPVESSGFLAAGFEVREELHLLAHDLIVIPDVDPAPTRRAAKRDHPAVLEVDHEAFPPFWRLDALGLIDAVQATPQSRFRVSDGHGGVIAYAITGRAGKNGYVQRLAVDPDERGHGLGAALVVDGLRWLRRWRVEHAVVNTQLDNGSALGLYERLGFRRQARGLSVLSTGLS